VRLRSPLGRREVLVELVELLLLGVEVDALLGRLVLGGLEVLLGVGALGVDAGEGGTLQEG